MVGRSVMAVSSGWGKVKDVDEVIVVMLDVCKASVAIRRDAAGACSSQSQLYGGCGNTEGGQRRQEWPSSVAMFSVVGGVAFLNPTTVFGHRMVVCFLRRSTNEGLM